MDYIQYLEQAVLRGYIYAEDGGKRSLKTSEILNIVKFLAKESGVKSTEVESKGSLPTEMFASPYAEVEEDEDNLHS